MTKRNISVALLVSTYNWPAALELVLNSVMNQTRLPDEILIADDGSGEDTEAVIRKFRARSRMIVKHAWQPDHGFRKTVILNKTLKLTNADYIIQIDGDIILHPNFIEDHLLNMEEGKFVQGARVILSEKLTEKTLSTKETTFSLLSPGIKNRFNALRIPGLSFLIKENDDSVNSKGCNFAFWRKDYVAINGFDNQFNGWGSEDREFAARLINLGVRKKRLKLAAVCYHLHHDCNAKNKAIINHRLCEATIYEKRKVALDGYLQV